jgi:hypothetical protein
MTTKKENLRQKFSFGGNSLRDQIKAAPLLLFATESPCPVISVPESGGYRKLRLSISVGADDGHLQFSLGI